MPETTPQVAIVHNHWIHYKDTLFRAMLSRPVRFTVLLTAAGSTERLAPALANCPYKVVVGYQGAYEDVGARQAAAHVWQSLGRVHPRCVIISGWCDVAAWIAWVWCLIHRVPMILWSESNAFDRRRSWWRELPKRIFVGRMKAAHVYGSSNTRYLVSLGMSGERIFEKRAVVDTGLFRPVPERRNPGPCKVLLFVGRFVMVKNLPFLLRAFAAVRQNRQAPKLALRLVGYGPLENEMRNLAQDLGIGPLVEFHGAASQAELPGIYSAADIFVLPSISETFGMVVLEAMACGLPVVVSRRCGCASDLATAQTGWTFDPFCEADLTAVLERVAGLDAGELRRMGMAGRELAQAYSPERCADTVVRSVKRALQAAAGGEIGART